MIDDDYAPELLALSPTERLLRSQGIDLQQVRGLGDLVLGDLDPAVGGVGWWAGGVPVQFSILVGDFLQQSVAAIPDGLLRAYIALDDLETLWTEEEGRWRESIRIHGGSTHYPFPVRPSDETGHSRQDFLLQSVFDSFGRILDHVAALLIAVFDLRRHLRRADWAALRKTWSAETLDLEGMLDSAGPAGWLTWTLDYRNMLAHRPRQAFGTSMKLLGGPQLVAVGLDGYDRFSLSRHLIRYPNLSFV